MQIVKSVLSVFVVTTFATSAGGMSLVAAAAPGQSIWYVDDDTSAGEPTGNRTSPFRSIQRAIDISATGDEVVVLDGTYTGGLDFSGKLITVRSTNSPDYCIISGGVIVFRSGETAAAQIEGFTISGGRATTSSGDPWGGGMLIYRASPTVADCVFESNSAEWDGGGIAIFRGSPTIINCTFIGNTAGHDGGGICNRDGSPMLTNCVFVGNSADNDGGGLFTDSYFEAADVTLTNCVFVGNTAGETHGYGGGLWSGGDSTLINCLFSGNSAFSSGGICSFWDSTMLANCTITGNSGADVGGGIYAAGFNSSTAAANSILWGNSDGGGMDEAAQVHASWGHLDVNHSCVQDLDHFATNGVGNIGVDPLLADPVGPDGIPGTEDDDVHLSAGSPCIDAGNNTAVPFDNADLDGDGDTAERTPLDLAGNPRFVDDPDTDDTGVPDPPGYLDIVDMGAYEFFPECRMIVIDGCDTGVANLLLAGEGCTMADRIAECAEGARNHGAFVSCVAHLSNGWKRAGLISGGEKGSIQQCAAQANIP